MEPLAGAAAVAGENDFTSALPQLRDKLGHRYVDIGMLSAFAGEDAGRLDLER